jgi:16S rRNA G966 N2-methylase RsmD
MYSYKSYNDFIKDYNIGKISFPYKRLMKTDADIKSMFNKLKKFKFTKKNVINQHFKIHNLKIASNRLTFLGHPVLIINYNIDYEKYNISDMFQEENRMKCKFFSAISSPVDYFNANLKKLALQILKKNDIITPLTLREELYISVRECSAFKPTNMIYIIKLFDAKSVLDPSSGWGDRLIAAMSLNIRYVGIDPNTDLHAVYNKMIEFFVPKKNRKKYLMIDDTIQNANIPNEKFDLVFTSPPYFKIEQYNNRGRVIDDNEDDWFNNFMKPMITKTINKLNEGGHLVLVINQLSHEHYIQKMIDYIYDCKRNLHYLGVIGYVNENMKNPQPMWIWENCKKVPANLYNPPIIITDHEYNSVKFKVFRDDYLIGGTKQRALVPLLEKTKKQKFIYAGPIQGFAQVALAYTAELMHKTAVLFLTKQKNRSDITKFALKFKTVELHEIENGYLKKLQEYANTYHKKNNDSYLISFGCSDPLYINELEKSIRNALPPNLKPKRIWIVAGSGIVLKTLYKIFPHSYFMVVQVGKTIYPDQINDKTTLFISDEKFIDIAIEQPPYPTVKTYDAKLWHFFKIHGKNGDYIYNIAKDPV